MIQTKRTRLSNNQPSNTRSAIDRYLLVEPERFILSDSTAIGSARFPSPAPLSDIRPRDLQTFNCFMSRQCQNMLTVEGLGPKVIRIDCNIGLYVKCFTKPAGAKPDSETSRVPMRKRSFPSELRITLT